MRELTIASNMIALARSRDAGGKRSAMLRMVMPFLSNESGEHLANVIQSRDTDEFSKLWDRLRGEIVHKLKASKKNVAKPHHVKPHKSASHPHQKKHVAKHPAKHGKHHKAHAADIKTFVREQGTTLNIQTYDDDPNICIHVNGHTLIDGAPPAQKVEDNPEYPVGTRANTHQAIFQIDCGDRGMNFMITDSAIVELLYSVCQRLVKQEDPCPLPEQCCVRSGIEELYNHFTACNAVR